MRTNLAPILILAACSGGSPSSQSVPLATDEQKTFYALGQSLARGLGTFDMTPEELNILQRGLADAVLKKKAEVELSAYGPKIGELARARGSKKAEAEKKKGESFLAAAAKEAGATKLDSGLVFRSLSPGTGAQPTAADTVKVNYTGTLTDGTVFDSSAKHGEPARFPLGGVIKCWTEGVAKMHVGEKAKLTCPSAIAYGDRGAPPTIPGGAVLTFEVELLEIVKTPDAPPQMQLNLPPGHPAQLQPGTMPMHKPAIAPVKPAPAK